MGQDRSAVVCNNLGMDTYGVTFRLPATPGNEQFIGDMDKPTAQAVANEARQQNYLKVQVVKVR